MSLHRLLGFHVDVPGPDDLVAFYGELGLRGERACVVRPDRYAFGRGDAERLTAEVAALLGC